MLNTKITTVPTSSRNLLAELNIADTYSLGSNNNNPFKSKTNLNATASQSQTLYQPYTASNIGPSTSLLSSSSVPTVKLINHPPAITPNYTVLSAAMNKCVKTFD